ncbi:Uncharacterised protein [Budvicia aquatica]|uniref:Uncharacterized protein n=1 Tax=Budvicia aquatica TaxID=82979 RepID=A0A484ZI59_9GAMM|nr:Uncharacterised protein [Budvicia aquatica]
MESASHPDALYTPRHQPQKFTFRPKPWSPHTTPLLLLALVRGVKVYPVTPVSWSVSVTLQPALFAPIQRPVQCLWRKCLGNVVISRIKQLHRIGHAHHRTGPRHQNVLAVRVQNFSP